MALSPPQHTALLLVHRQDQYKERERVRVHCKALSLQGKRASLLVEAILMSGSMLMWGVIVPTAVGHAWYQG